MKKVTLIHTPVNVRDLRLEEYFDEEMFGDWQLRAERLVKRNQKRLRLSNM